MLHSVPGGESHGFGASPFARDPRPQVVRRPGMEALSGRDAVQGRRALQLAISVEKTGSSCLQEASKLAWGAAGTEQRADSTGAASLACESTTRSLLAVSCGRSSG